MSFADRMQTPDDILSLFDEFSVEGANGVITTAPVVIGGGIKQTVGGNEKDLHHNKMARDERIAFVELRKSTTGADMTKAETAVIDGIKSAKGAGGEITADDFPEITRQKQLINARLGQTESRRGRSTLKTMLHPAPSAAAVPCYLLPWNPTGGAVELKIPDMGGGPVADDNPILFLTAALSGCPVYVKGPAHKSTILHCGTQSDTTGASASAFWNGVMRQLGHDVGTLAVAHNKDYTAHLRGAAKEVKDAKAREAEAKKPLQKRHNDVLEVEEVASWGAVFGVRRGRDWSFYMQENCTVTYHKVRKSKYLGRRLDAGEGSRIYSRPMYCRQIFPAGGAKAQCFQQLRMLKV